MATIDPWGVTDPVVMAPAFTEPAVDPLVWMIGIGIVACVIFCKGSSSTPPTFEAPPVTPEFMPPEFMPPEFMPPEVPPAIPLTDSALYLVAAMAAIALLKRR